MKNINILMIKNEDDVIAETLTRRLRVFDNIIIVDSSDDATPSICKEFKEKYPDKILYRHDTHPLENRYFRNLLLDLARTVADDGDWIWQLDADHVLFSLPSVQQEKAEIEKANLIVGDVAQFYMTEEDLSQKRHWMQFPYYSTNWRLPIAYKLHQGLAMHGKNGETPTVIDKKQASIRPIVLHFQYRSVPQIKKRLAHAYKKGGYGHIYSDDWVDYIIDKELLNKTDSWLDIKRTGMNWKTLYTKSNEVKNREELRKLYDTAV